MNSYIVLESPGGRLLLAEVGPSRLRMALRAGLQIRWDREGEVRVLPRHVIENALRAYKDGQRALAAGRLASAFEQAHSLYWEQTEPLPGLEAHAKVRPKPRPGVGEHPGGGAGVQ